MYRLPKIFSFFSGALTRLEWVCLNSFVHHGFEVSVYSCDKLELPEGVKLKCAQPYVDCEKILQYRSDSTGRGGSPSLQSNFFRYRYLLSSQNTCWVDTDVLCLAPFRINREYVFGFEKEGIANCAVLGVGIEGDSLNLLRSINDYISSPFAIDRYDPLRITLKKILHRIQRRSTVHDIPWGLTGPNALTVNLKKLNLQHLGLDENTFYPIPHQDCLMMFEHISNYEFQKLVSTPWCIHLWNEVLMRKDIDKNRVFHHSSPYERIIRMNNLDYGWVGSKGVFV